jgi:hypothetical protein
MYLEDPMATGVMVSYPAPVAVIRTPTNSFAVSGWFWPFMEPHGERVEKVCSQPL